jgi:predicted MFS family arabinose efflux permease
VLIVNLFMVMTSMPYFFLLPGFVEDVLGGGSMRLGLLMSVQGIGSLIGSLAIASIEPKRRGRLLLLSGFCMAIALVVFFWTTWVWASAAMLGIAGLGQAARQTLSNVLVQTYTKADYRGRVMSVYMMEFSVVMIGVFFVGVTADRFGIQEALTGTAVALFLVMAYAWFFMPTFRHLD